MWLRHTEEPREGRGRHHSLRHYLLIFKAAGPPEGPRQRQEEDAVISESDGCAERPRANGDERERERERERGREWQRALYVSPVIPAFLWPNMFPLVRAG